MADQDYPQLYQQMKDSAQAMSDAAVANKQMMTGDQNTDVDIPGYGLRPSYAKQIYNRVSTLTKVYTSEAEAQAAITAGDIPEGWVMTVSKDGDDFIYLQYKNVGGTLTPVLDSEGRQKAEASYAYISKQLDRLSRAITESLINAGIFNVGGDNAFEIASAAGQLAAFIDNNGLFGVNSGLFKLGDNSMSPLPESSEYAFAISDDAGRTVFGVGKDSWVEILGMRMYKGGPTENCLAITDEQGAMAASISNKGVVTLYDSGTTPTPSEEWPVLDFFERLHIFVYGQSLSIGAQGTPALSTTKNPDGQMYNSGILSRNSGIPSAFWQLVEAGQETICSGFAHEFVKKSGGMNGRKVVMNAGGVGGYRIEQLAKGTPPYAAALAQFNWAGPKMAADGFQYSLEYMFWIQGEANMGVGTTGGAYKTMLKQLRTDLEEDTVAMRPAGVGLKVLTYQTSSHGFYNGSTENPHPEQIALAQLELGLTDPNFDCVCPTYYGPHASVSGNVHHTNHGYRWMGLYFQKALRYKMLTGEKWKPLHPTKAVRINSKTLMVDFHVPVPPLKFDEVNITPLEDGMKGVEVHDNTGRLTVTSVTIVGATQLKVTTSQDIGEGAFFATALTPENRGTYDPATNRWPDWYFGPVTGLRTNICDSDPETTDLIGPYGRPYDLHNFCVISKIEVS